MKNTILLKNVSRQNEPLSAKVHYEILDGLRGVAAIIVVCFHLFEAHATSHFDIIINHGYLAVDFFFVLSGFVIGYAYDDRWKRGLSLKVFFKRRLIRLQPMILLGTLIGAMFFYWGYGSNVEQTSILQLVISTLLACLLIPIPLSMDIRGWTEMYPLNGPQWSLFFEYIANLLYALIIHRFSKKVLSIFVVLFACLTLYFLFTNSNGDVIGGWSLTNEQLYVGMTRLLYPFFAGLLLSRLKLSIQIPYAFLFCSLFIILILAMPRIGDQSTIWMNAIYESVAILFLFPLVVVVGSSSKSNLHSITHRSCKLLGKISYPLYLIHYPFVYIYFKYARSSEATFSGCLFRGVAILLFCLLFAYLCERFYDAPIRSWLKQRSHK